MRKQFRLSGVDPPQPVPCSPLVRAEPFVFPLRPSHQEIIQRAQCASERRSVKSPVVANPSHHNGPGPTRLTAAVAVVKLKRTSTAGVTQQSMPTRPERSPSPIPNLWEPCLKSFSPISLLPSETEPRDNQPCHSQEHSYQEQCPCAGSDMKARFSHAEPPSMRKRSRSSTLR